MMTVVDLHHVLWFRVTGAVQSAVKQSLNSRLSQAQTVLTPSSVVTVSATAALLAKTEVIGVIALWFRVTGPVQIVVRKSLSFLLSQVATALSAAATATEQIVLRVRIDAGSKSGIGARF